MSKFLKICFYFILFIGMAGCGYKMKAYSQVRDRVDIDMPGNVGYLSGDAGSSQGTMKRTRKVYVMEFVKEPQMEREPDKAQAARSGQREPAYQSVDSVPRFDVVDEGRPSSSAGRLKAGGYTEYTVEKDDTLQKISKKFYNNFGSWTKIYDANKEQIKNPNFLKPGIVLRIPPQQGSAQ